MPSVTKKLLPSLLTRDKAKQIVCQSLYDTYRKSTGTNNVAISVRGASFHETFGHTTHTNATLLPHSTKTILDYCPTGYEYYEVMVNFTQDHLPHDQQMTRGEFLVELLDVLEDKYNKLSDSTKKTLGLSYLDAMDLIRNTYEVRELTDLSYMEGAD